ncbi:hypothetical protein [Methanobrevibacter sp.]|uniref:hypothetical protein n=1 Tax=Methanobrevibacter sp. TaxID=66852 RepID=UPI0038673824
MKPLIVHVFVWDISVECLGVQLTDGKDTPLPYLKLLNLILMLSFSIKTDMAAHQIGY